MVWIYSFHALSHIKWMQQQLHVQIDFISFAQNFINFNIIRIVEIFYVIFCFKFNKLQCNHFLHKIQRIHFYSLISFRFKQNILTSDCILEFLSTFSLSFEVLLLNQYCVKELKKRRMVQRIKMQMCNLSSLFFVETINERVI